MTTVLIPGDQISSELDLHKSLAGQLDFGPYYGKNLDALWDRLTTDVERPVHIIWSDSQKSREQLGEDLFEKIVELLRKAEARDAGSGRSERLTVEIRD
jgi:ribonuclease inhibitor